MYPSRERRFALLALIFIFAIAWMVFGCGASSDSGSPGSITTGGDGTTGTTGGTTGTTGGTTGTTGGTTGTTGGTTGTTGGMPGGTTGTTGGTTGTTGGTGTTGTPAPPTVGTPPSGTVGSNPAASPQWSATISSTSNPNMGSISVTTAGDVIVALTGAQPSSGFSLQFCQFPQATFTAQSGDACFLVATITTDPNGAAQTTVHFPQIGVWAGHFFFTFGLGQVTADISTDRAALSGNFTAQLVPMSVANGAVLSSPTDLQLPFTSGSVVVSSQLATITVNGTIANRTFNVFQCANSDSATCTFIAGVGSDSTGTAAVSASVNLLSGGSIFQVLQTTQSAGGFVSGFTVQ